MVLLIGSWRYGYALVLKLGLFNQKIILLGSGELAQSIYEEIIAAKGTAGIRSTWSLKIAR